MVLIREHVSGHGQASGKALMLAVVKAQPGPPFHPIRDVMLTLNGPSACLEVTPTNAVGFHGFRRLATSPYTVTPTKPGCEFDPPEQMLNLTRRAALVRFTGACW